MKTCLALVLFSVLVPAPSQAAELSQSGSANSFAGVGSLVQQVGAPARPAWVHVAGAVLPKIVSSALGKLSAEHPAATGLIGGALFGLFGMRASFVPVAR